MVAEKPKAQENKGPNDEAAAKRAQREAARKKRRGGGEEGGFVVLLIVGLLGLAAINMTVAGLVFVGLIPSLVMSVTDRHPMTATRIHVVTFMNMAGVVPFATRIYNQPNDWEAVMFDPVTMVIMWGAATGGYMLLYIGPMVGSIFLQSFNQDKLKSLTQQRQDLIDLWGSELMADVQKQAPTEETSGPRQKLINPSN